MKREVSIVEFTSHIPHPSKGGQSRSHFGPVASWEDGFCHVYRVGDDIEVHAPRSGKVFVCPWANVLFLEYRNDGQETSPENHSRDSEEAEETNEPGPGGDTVRASEGVRTRRRKK